MAAPKSQRIFIWIIAGVMLIGSLGAYFAIILANDNGAVTDPEQAALQKQIEEYQKQQTACPTGEVAELKVDPAPIPPSAPVLADIPELKTQEVTVGSGAAVKESDCVVLFYHGTLAVDGKAFEGGDNYASGVPYRSLSSGFVPGFAEGLVGMQPGGERQILIPSALGYGEQGQGDIPANADLVFTVKLVQIHTQ